jgi:hypothetical protein
VLNGIQDCGWHIVCDRYPEEHTVLFTGQYLSSSSALARRCIAVESFLRPCQSLVSRVRLALLHRPGPCTTALHHTGHRRSHSCATGT